MSEFIIYKREKCVPCGGTGISSAYLTRKSWDAVEASAPLIPIDVNGEGAIGCPACDGLRYIDTPVDAESWLLETLGRVRWDERVLSGNVMRTRSLGVPYLVEGKST